MDDPDRNGWETEGNGPFTEYAKEMVEEVGNESFRRGVSMWNGFLLVGALR